jgi:hypothetical protein
MMPYSLEDASADIADLRSQLTILQEVGQVTDGGVVPNTPAANTYAMFSSSGQPTFVNPQGLTMGVSGGQLANVSPTTVTAAALTNIAAGPVIPANDAQVGSVYKLTAFGHGTWSSSTGISLNIATTLGGITGSGPSIGTVFFNTSQAFRWHAQVHAVCLTTGVGGTWFLGGLMAFGPITAAAVVQGQVYAGVPTSTSTSISVDTTAQETLRLQLGWSATTGSPTVTCDACWGERLA